MSHLMMSVLSLSRRRALSTASTALSPAQWSFFKRNLPQFNETDLQSAFQSSTATLEDYSSTSRQLITQLGEEYLNTRFPRLHLTASLQELSRRLFAAPQNLIQLSRQLGISAAFGAEADEVGSLLSLIHTIHQKSGMEGVKAFLDTRYFGNASFSKESLLTEAYPVVKLTQVLRMQYNDPSLELLFRLHQESGRLSNDSMYVVGVYDPRDTSSAAIGEGFGASMALAQQRAALDALRRMFLQEK